MCASCEDAHTYAWKPDCHGITATVFRWWLLLLLLLLLLVLVLVLMVVSLPEFLANDKTFGISRETWERLMIARHTTMVFSG